MPIKSNVTLCVNVVR